jgi:hypothetical protein
MNTTKDVQEIQDHNHKPQGSALFIDDKSKRIFWEHELIHKESHMTNAFWIPALGQKAWDGHIYISGATGSGKSYIIRKIINNDKKKRSCILFTDLSTDDPAFHGMDFDKFKTKDEDGKQVSPFDSNWIKKNEFNKILIFDDVQFNKEVIKYRDFMIEKGRHMGTVVICVNHKLQDYFSTRVPLNDARFVVAFPCANRGAVARYLKHEMEINKYLMEDILDIACEEGRHIIIHKHAPNCVATTESIFKI